MDFKMQTKLGNHHQSMKTFPNGNPIRECFWKKLRLERARTHLKLILEEEYNVSNLQDEDMLLLYAKDEKKYLQELRMRGYFII